LDEAHDDHLVKQVAAEATAATKFGVNSLKRRKMVIFTFNFEI